MFISVTHLLSHLDLFFPESCTDHASTHALAIKNEEEIMLPRAKKIKSQLYYISIFRIHIIAVGTYK